MNCTSPGNVNESRWHKKESVSNSLHSLYRKSQKHSHPARPALIKRYLTNIDVQTYMMSKSYNAADRQIDLFSSSLQPPHCNLWQLVASYKQAIIPSPQFSVALISDAPCQQLGNFVPFLILAKNLNIQTPLLLLTKTNPK